MALLRFDVFESDWLALQILKAAPREGGIIHSRCRCHTATGSAAAATAVNQGWLQRANRLDRCGVLEEGKRRRQRRETCAQI